MLGSDHAGFRLKEHVKAFLEKEGFEYEDIGTFDEKKSCDYPETALKLAKKVIEQASKGILMCGTGIGEAIVANKVKGIRAANCFDKHTARMSREHNDSNILCLGARILSKEIASKIVKTWLATEFSKEERHKRRVNQIKEIEEKLCN